MCVHACCRVHLFVIPWTVAHQAPLSMRFSRLEYWNELPFPSPMALPNSGIKPLSLSSPALSGRFFTTRATWTRWSVQQRNYDSLYIGMSIEPDRELSSTPHWLSYLVFLAQQLPLKPVEIVAGFPVLTNTVSFVLSFSRLPHWSTTCPIAYGNQSPLRFFSWFVLGSHLYRLQKLLQFEFSDHS